MPATAIFRLLAALVAALTFQAACAQELVHPVGEKHLQFTDQSRPIKKSMGFAGSANRRIDVTVWYPAAPQAKRSGKPAALAKGGPWPLLVFSHGTFGKAAQFAQTMGDLASHGYVVAAPDFPLTSSAAWTGVSFADISDVGEQVKDIRFLIGELVRDSALAPAIDAERIAVGGHSLGGVTSYFTVFGAQTRDPRIKAAVLVGASDPVQTALSQDIGLFGTAHSFASPPVLFLSAEQDLFARLMGRPHVAFSRVEPPKYEVMIKGGAHVWFHDGSDRHPEGKNPDCLFFERAKMKVPGCDGPASLIDPDRQHAITRIALRAFLDGTLKRDGAAIARLRGLGSEYPEAKVLTEP
jgi:predicted dienelactone hydrolase